MDSKGAQELARILAERRQSAAPGPIPPIEAAGAAPIYYWIGVEPPAGEPEDKA